MKVVFLIVLVAAMNVAGIDAQAQSNTLLVYGTVSAESQKLGNSNANGYTFAPGVGYQWNDNWTAGLNLDLSGSKNTAKSSFVSAGPFIRYAQPLAGPFAIYGQFNANFLSGKIGSTTYNGFQGTLFPAIGVDLKNSFALNFTFGALSFTTQKSAGEAESQSSFRVAFGSGAGFGISKNFGLRK